MEALHPCDYTTCQGQSYWRLDCKKNLCMVDIGDFLEMQTPVSELQMFGKPKPDTHLNPILLEVQLGRHALQCRRDRL